mmetsp:Transcript_59674/g.146366  ORF Transcript_59674/g.146366 Transcript_59674/m.146366 type:complete len:95 (-) Transcript_59674:1422-1706(-)
MLPDKTNRCQIAWSKLLFRTKNGTPAVYPTPPKTINLMHPKSIRSLISGRHITAHHPIPRYILKLNVFFHFQVGYIASTDIPSVAQSQITANNP